MLEARKGGREQARSPGGRDEGRAGGGSMGQRETDPEKQPFSRHTGNLKSEISENRHLLF